MDGLDETLAEASELLRNGQGAAAIPRLLEAVAANPSSFTAQMYLGMANAQAQQFPEAIQAFQKAIAIQPTDASTYYNLGVAYQRSGQVEAAGRAFDRALQLDPNHAKAAAALESIRSHAAPAPPPPPPPITVAPVAPQPAVAPPLPPPVMPRPGRATAPGSRAAEKASGGAKGILIPIAVVVVLAAAAGVYFFFLAPSPKKVAQAYLVAAQKKDYAQLSKICTKGSQQFIDLAKKFSGSNTESITKFDLGKTTVEGDAAKVMASLSLKMPANPFMGQTTSSNVDLKAPIVLLKEEGKWKVDLMKTQSEQSMAFVQSPAGKAMMEEVQKRVRGMGGNPFTR